MTKHSQELNCELLSRELLSIYSELKDSRTKVSQESFNEHDVDSEITRLIESEEYKAIVYIFNEDRVSLHTFFNHYSIKFYDDAIYVNYISLMNLSMIFKINFLSNLWPKIIKKAIKEAHKQHNRNLKSIRGNKCRK